ncbi:TELO2-interacting protein 1 homolog isoform X2 [Leptopilina heterotoma]|uniref:TELO2-interacting protein 1 homolog isoform X2 n=1 Tax=Leptopilina heterotoma TaxID=63436 RepID=UPI001CA87F51|nr:TELO2-interacting protein 1 homolog isoform X2 [Leptopilina heterotoma]
MEITTMDEAFNLIKPLCDRLLNHPNIENAIQVAKVAEKCSNTILENLMEYVMIPVTMHLFNKDMSKDVKQQLLNTMRIVISKTRITKINVLNHYFVCVISEIFTPSKAEMLIPFHEELKESAILCIKCLIERCTTDVLELLYTPKNVPKLSNGVFLCILIARTEKSRTLRIAAIETVMVLLQVHDAADNKDIVFRSQVADSVMVILPGVSSGLLEVATGSDIQGHKLTIIAIRSWSRIIALVMEDSVELESEPLLDSICKKSEISTKQFQKTLKFQKSEDVKTYIESAKRTPEWFQFASNKLNILMNELNTLASHSHFKVRRELAVGINLLLTKCPRNMKPSFSKLIEILITLSEDESEEVVNTAKFGLNSISAKCYEEKGMKSLVELFEDNFYKLLTTLPRIMRTADDSMQLSYLNQLTAYLRLLGKQRLPQVMLSSVHLQRMILALVYVAELDCNGISVLEDFSSKHVDNIHYTNCHSSWRQFKFINSSSAEKKLMIICQLLGELGDFEILIDTFLKLMFDIPQYRKELTVLLNWIVQDPNSEKLLLYRQTIDQYIAPDFWYLPLEVSEDVNLREVQSNLIQCCLLVEGLGNIAEILKKDYDQFLLKTLYIVLERTGSGHSLLRTVGLEALEKITKSQYNTTGELLQKNVDYISYHVTLKLRQVKRNPGVLDVLGVVMEFSTMDFLPCLKEIVNDVLRQSNEKIQKDNTDSFLRVFYTFTKCVRRLTLKNEAKLNEEKDLEYNSKERIIHQLVEYKKLKELANLENIEKKIEEPVSIEEIEEEMKSSAYDYVEEEREEEKIPEYVKMIEEVMKRCLHFLPSKDLTISTRAMITLNEGLFLLADWENQLLPIVHVMWHPLVDRFRDSNPIIINRAWQLFITLAHVSKDFIRARTLKKLLPPLSEFLSKSSGESYKKDSGSMYNFTQIFKLQKELLSQFGHVARDLQLHEGQLWEILEICEPYLSCLQNKFLQESCVTLYKNIADYNSDIVWTKCLALWNKHVERMDAISFQVWYKKIDESETQNEYRRNLQTIFKYIKQKDIL